MLGGKVPTSDAPVGGQQQQPAEFEDAWDEACAPKQVDDS